MDALLSKRGRRSDSPTLQELSRVGVSLTNQQSPNLKRATWCYFSTGLGDLQRGKEAKEVRKTKGPDQASQSRIKSGNSHIIGTPVKTKSEARTATASSQRFTWGSGWAILILRYESLEPKAVLSALLSARSRWSTSGIPSPPSKLWKLLFCG